MASGIGGGLFTPGEFVDAVVSFVEGPRKFYVQPLSSAVDLRRLTKKMQTLYGSSLLNETDYAITLDHLAFCLRTNTPCWCAAPFAIETAPDKPPIPSYYYRAVVLERVSPSAVKVFFVDYGNVSKVSIASLKTLPGSYYQELPCMAVPCRLIEGEISGGSKNSINPLNFRSTVDGFHVVVHVSPSHVNVVEQKLPHLTDPLWVSVFVTDGKDDVNIGEMLLADQFAAQQNGQANNH